ncbi:hypothetical protein HGM15179_010689 [Zosterops borbonicus]|uniref:Uncharacterized protein n=1 Tax=Zosterops borbonicus TaxID=364589 RepID=A0A8K1LJR5_9PASS|nr:hypothetical protein HGM15179_010689 [Zosterops borbonicus]
MFKKSGYSSIAEFIRIAVIFKDHVLVWFPKFLLEFPPLKEQTAITFKRAECTLRQFAADTKLGGVADGPCCHPEPPQHAGETADGNLMKFNKVKCKVLHLGRNNPTHQYILETDQLESSLTEKDLMVLLDSRLNMSQEPALSAKQADSCIRQNIASMSKDLSSLHNTGKAMPGVFCLVLGIPVQERHGHTGENPAQSISHMRKG